MMERNYSTTLVPPHSHTRVKAHHDRLLAKPLRMVKVHLTVTIDVAVGGPWFALGAHPGPENAYRLRLGSFCLDPWQPRMEVIDTGTTRSSHVAIVSGLMAQQCG